MVSASRQLPLPPVSYTNDEIAVMFDSLFLGAEDDLVYWIITSELCLRFDKKQMIGTVSLERLPEQDYRLYTGTILLNNAE